MKSYEINFDGIVGPTHNYSGRSVGNYASMEHRASVSNPREAALQGLKKMKLLLDLGIKQAILPPQERPNIPVLKQLGFNGSDSEILKKVSKEAPEILLDAASASSMWAANSATITPSVDSQDHKVHMTPANLSHEFHRSIESDTTGRVLRVIFPDDRLFVHHPALPGEGSVFLDEGAANHTRLCGEYEKKGIYLFVFGQSGGNPLKARPMRFPARQTLEASQAISRLHRLDPDSVIYAQQNPDAIDAGVFHNDVISVGNQELFLYHEFAFQETDRIVALLEKEFSALGGKPPCMIAVTNRQVSLEESVASYLFNSQLINRNQGKMSLIAPIECQEHARVKNFIDALIQRSDNPIEEVHYIDLKQSMQNGGGPACLRLRIILTEEELTSSHQGVYLDEALYLKLTDWIGKHYRDRLSIEELSDPNLLIESRTALDELSQILGLGSIYPFQLGN